MRKSVEAGIGSEVICRFFSPLLFFSHHLEDLWISSQFPVPSYWRMKRFAIQLQGLEFLFSVFINVRSLFSISVLTFLKKFMFLVYRKAHFLGRSWTFLTILKCSWRSFAVFCTLILWSFVCINTINGNLVVLNHGAGQFFWPWAAQRNLQNVRLKLQYL